MLRQRLSWFSAAAVWTVKGCCCYCTRRPIQRPPLERSPSSTGRCSCLMVRTASPPAGRIDNYSPSSSRRSCAATSIWTIALLLIPLLEVRPHQRLPEVGGVDDRRHQDFAATPRPVHLTQDVGPRGRSSSAVRRPCHCRAPSMPPGSRPQQTACSWGYGRGSRQQLALRVARSEPDLSGVCQSAAAQTPHRLVSKTMD